MAKAPGRFPPPWSTYRAVSLNTRSMGTMPLDVPLEPRMYDLVARMLWIDSPMPPAYLEMLAQLLSVS